MPTVANTQDIGSETVPWRYVYAQSLFGDGAGVTNLNMDNAEDGILAVARGGTGTSNFTANSVVISGATTTAALTTRSIKNMTTKGNLGWTANTTDNTIVTTNTMAYWNGRYNSSSSNLTYCNQGAFGTMATKSADDYILKSVLSGAYDIMYSSAANTPARLAANTATTKKFLSMTGTGSAGAAPTWDTLAATDIPNLNWSKITSGKPTTISGYGITDAKIASGVITLGSNTITPVTSVNGHTGNSVTVTATDLGLSNAMHFIGKATTTITDGGDEDPGITNYSPVPGDVVISSDDHYEYVWTLNNHWELLGGDSSYKIVQQAVNYKLQANENNKWISEINQNENGEITVNYSTLVTSGPWSGKANTAGIADKISNLTSTDNASSSDGWRKVWISYADGVTGRPAISDKFVYQTSTNTLKTNHILVEHVKDNSKEVRVTYGSTIDFWFGVGTANANHGIYDEKKSDWVLVANTDNNWSFKGIADKATGDGNGNNIVNTYLTKAAGVTNVAYDSTNKKITKTINGTTTDVVTLTTLKTDMSLNNVSNSATLNSTTGAKGDIIYWSAANTPAHLTNTSSTTKHFLSITSQVPAWTTLSKGDVGLGNVENTALSTWAGSNKITTIGTLSSGTVPLARVSDADDLKKIEALTGTSGLLKKTAANTWSLDTTTYLTTMTKIGDIAVSVNGSTATVDSTPIEIEIIRL